MNPYRVSLVVEALMNLMFLNEFLTPVTNTGARSEATPVTQICTLAPCAVYLPPQSIPMKCTLFLLTVTIASTVCVELASKRMTSLLFDSTAS